MQRTRVFQLGDVHLPDHGYQELDLKDHGFSATLLSEMQISPLRQVIRHLQQLVGPDDIVIVHGDLTSRGDMDGYQRAARLIIESLVDPATGSAKCAGIYVVPGNHDINRPQAVKAPPADLETKFQHMVDVWNPLPDVTFEPHRCAVSRVPDTDGALQIVLLNSCIGCGEPHGEQDKVDSYRDFLIADHSLPPDAAAELIQQVLELMAAGTKEPAIHAHLLTYLPEENHRERAIRHFPLQIGDAPMFRQADLEIARDAIADGGPELINLLVAHHPVLPQELPRVDLYPELVNAGQARSMFMAADRTVVYLHGHTHHDPVEEVRRFRPTLESMLTVGVPELAEGFNVLEFQLAEDGRPIGAIITFIGNRTGLGPSANLEPVRVQLPGGRASMRSEVRDLYDGIRSTGDGPYSTREVCVRFELEAAKAKELILELEWHERAVVLGERGSEVLDFRLR